MRTAYYKLQVYPKFDYKGDFSVLDGNKIYVGCVSIFIFESSHISIAT